MLLFIGNVPKTWTEDDFRKVVEGVGPRVETTELIKVVVALEIGGALGCCWPVPEIPENLYHLIKKVVSIRNHLERNKKDKDSKFRLILVDSRIHRLARYYSKTKKLPPVWK
ncbi:40S ribosomal protein S13-like [Glycine max]|uniref:40S ribosomal protein S13-like n=1 Tax=Glycine max TaxID=3847 RepID=UPI0003DE92FB|nr:40S ribosomal protein S13-like [Glycine max]|eukprot:XP_006596721.1 40S ribosomal protein S13-like [Glycine max]